MSGALLVMLMIQTNILHNLVKYHIQLIDLDYLIGVLVNLRIFLHMVNLLYLSTNLCPIIHIILYLFLQIIFINIIYVMLKLTQLGIKLLTNISTLNNIFTFTFV